MGGRSGIARGLSSAGASGFFWSAGAAAAGSPGVAATDGRTGGAIGAPRFGDSAGFNGSPDFASALAFVFAGAGVSAATGFSAGFGAFAASSTDVSPPK
jgi:hypothetical protein